MISKDGKSETLEYDFEESQELTRDTDPDFKRKLLEAERHSTDVFFAASMGLPEPSKVAR